VLSITVDSLIEQRKIAITLIDLQSDRLPVLSQELVGNEHKADVVGNNAFW
jgi:hypothetical protein